MEILIIITILLVAISYFLLIASYTYAWYKTKQPNLPFEGLQTKVAVIVALRNEEKNIENCIHALLAQKYPLHLVDIIFVDDDSDDSSAKIIQSFRHPNVRYIHLLNEKGKTGKKQAITAGIASSDAELIITTDADCVMNEHWLATIIAFYEQTNAKMIVSPVTFHNEKSIFEKMQTLEFMSLVAGGGASLYYNHATLCNGANIAYQRGTFEELNGFDNINQSPSGDDVLLMYKLKVKYPNGVKFLKHQDAIIYTLAQESVGHFMQQRKRWASKKFSSYNAETKITGIIVLGFNGILICLFLCSLFFNNQLIKTFSLSNIFFILFGIKCTIDFLLLTLATGFFKKRKLLVYFLPEEVLYMVYVVLVGLLGSMGNYEWKKRKIG